MNKPNNNLLRKSAYGTFLVILVLLAILTLWSSLGGFSHSYLLVVQSGSMSPTIKTGSLVSTQPQASYAVNDIISFRQASDQSPNQIITHRLVEINENEETITYTTKGDANTAPDSFTVSPDAVIGKVVLAIPYLGYPVGFAKTQTGFILLIVIPAILIIYHEVIGLTQEIKTKISNRKKDEATPQKTPTETPAT